METDVLYCPPESTFSTVQCLFKVSDAGLVGIQITRQNRDTETIAVAALKQLLCDKLGLQLHDAGVLQLYLVHRPASANTADLSIVAKQKKKMDKEADQKGESQDREIIVTAMPSYYVLEVLADYRTEY